MQLQMKDFMEYDFEISKVSSMFIKGCNGSNYRSRNDYALIYYPEGGYVFHFEDGTSLRTAKNTILFMPGGASYSIESYAAEDCWSISFFLAKPFPCAPFTINVRDARYFFEMFQDTERIYRQAQSGYLMHCKARLCSIIAAIQHEYSIGYVSNRKYSVIAPAVEKIHQCYTSETPSVTELAELCGITPEYLRALFNKKYGKSPIKYINDLRFARARELLDSGVYTVTDVSLLAGFSAPSYFSKEFKKKYGISPSRYLEEK